MAFQIYDKPMQPGLGEIIGQGLGSGAGSVLTHLAEQKLQDLQYQQQLGRQQQQQQQLSQQYKTLGLPETLGYLEPSVQAALGKQLMGQNQRSHLAEMLTGQQIPQSMDGAQQGMPGIQQQQVMQQPKGSPQFDYDAEKQRLGSLAAYDPRMYQQALADLNRRQEHAKDFDLKKQELGLKHAEHALTSEQKKEDFKTKQAEAEQRRIDSENKKPLEILQNRENVGTPLMNDMNDILTALDDPEVETGQLLRFKPEAMMNQPTLDLYKKLQKIVNSLGSGEVRGMLSKARIDLLNASKPSIYQSPEYIRKWINDYKRDWMPWIRKAQIRDRLILENDRKQPAGFQALINQTYKNEEPIYNVLDQFSPDQIKEGSEFIEPKSKTKLRKDSSSPLGFIVLKKGSK